jgi:hypothetical protein
VNRFRFFGAVAAVVVLVAVAGCSSEQRPSAQEWLPTWEAVVDTFPTYAELGDPPDEQLCSTALVELRSSAPSLRPTPDRSLDVPVEEWVSIAEAIAFDCPPESRTLPDLEYAYGELDRLEAEVSASIVTGAGG